MSNWDPMSRLLLLRTAWWDWSRSRCGLALRTRSSTSLTLTACPATNSWLNTDVKWLDSQWTPKMSTTGRDMIISSSGVSLIRLNIKKQSYKGESKCVKGHTAANCLSQSADILLQLWWDYPAVGLGQSQSEASVLPQLWSSLLHTDPRWHTVVL